LRRGHRMSEVEWYWREGTSLVVILSERQRGKDLA
jgi:hypothetical protein